ncbi:hypothetical protein [Rosistilla oblonga]|uniref:hypothetical protein n=1 Tax=Rosistilla oblonga TaxID=2527990 RepID=UPI003A9814C1
MNRITFLIALVASIAIGSLTPRSGWAQPIEKVSQSGPVSVAISLDPPEPLIGDPVTLRIEVQAEQDVEVLMPEFGEALDRFAIVDFVPREAIDDAGKTILSQQYRLQPAGSGKQAIPPILIEYVDNRPDQRQAPEGYDAYEILTDAIPFTVQSVLPDDVAADLNPPLGRLEPRQPPAPARWPWVLALVAVCAAASPFAWRTYTDWQRRRRRKSAYEVARWRLDQLLRQPRISADEIDTFYVDLSNLVRHYLEDRFELRAPELTTEEFLNSLQASPDMTRDHQSLLREFLRQADLVKFAGAVPSDADIGRSIDAASQFLEETRENAPLMEFDQDAPQHSEPQTPAATEVRNV